MKIHRILLYCFLIGFVGQLSIPYCVEKKITLELSDSDDDSNDSEDFGEEIAIELSVVHIMYELSLIDENIHGLRCWYNSNVKCKEILFSIDYPPEIS